MIKADLVDIVARETKITKTQAERAVNAAIDSLRDALMDGKRIELRGFGVFQVKPRKRGIGRNPGRGKKWKFLLVRQSGSSRKNCNIPYFSFLKPYIKTVTMVYV